jgi:3-dehydroquinate dehydratase/shikimate dehydrogenase
MIIVSITGPSLEEAEDQIRASRRYADIFELRSDLVPDLSVRRLKQLGKRPVIATCRPVWEGGAFAGAESIRLAVLHQLAEDGADYVDLEAELGKKVFRDFRKRHSGLRLIASKHYFDAAARRPAPAAVCRSLAATGADILKYAFATIDAWQIADAREFLKSAALMKRKSVAIAMGEHGESSRILYRKWGGWGTYAAPLVGAEAAPGQVRADVLRMLYRAESISKRTAVFGLIGNPVAHSKGIHLHNPLLRARKINAVYCRFAVTDVERFMKEVGNDVAGLSVTIPHKSAVMACCDELDETARRSGAVNTLVRKRGKFVGFNTDGSGALDAIESAIRVRGKDVLILGAGGTARAIAAEAKARGARVAIANRTHRKAVELAIALGVSAAGIREVPEVDVLVNCTPVGMWPNVDETPVPAGAIAARVAFDSVYVPERTRFLNDASAHGAIVIPGVDMFVNQAARQFELFTGSKPSRRAMRKLLGISKS